LFRDKLPTPSAYVHGTDRTLTFEGFLGCFPTEIEMKKDGAVIQFQDFIVYDEVHAQIAKIEWDLKPIDKEKHESKTFSAQVNFRRETGISQRYYKEAKITVVLKSRYHCSSCVYFSIYLRFLLPTFFK